MKLKESTMDLWIVHGDWAGDRYVFANSAAEAASSTQGYFNIETGNDEESETVDRVCLLANGSSCLLRVRGK